MQRRDRDTRENLIRVLGNLGGMVRENEPAETFC